MKKFFSMLLSLVLLCGTFFAFGMTASATRDENIPVVNGEKKIHYYAYISDGGPQVNYCEFFYDEDWLMTGYMNYEITGTNPAKYQDKAEFERNALKQISTITYSYYENTSWIPYSYVEFTYDAAGRTTRMDFYNYDDQGKKVFDNYEEFSYNPDGTKATYKEAYGAGTPTETYSYAYTYDEKQQLITEVFQYFKNGQLDSGNTSTYTYDAQGRRTMTERVDMNNKKTFKETATYTDEEGKEVISYAEFIGNDQNEWQPYGNYNKRVISKNGNAETIETYYKSLTMQDWSPTGSTTTTTELDFYGNLLREEMATYSGSGTLSGTYVKTAKYYCFMTAGMGQEVNLWETGITATFTSNLDSEDFSGITVDGVAVDAQNYETGEDPTTVTLSNAYLSTLAMGEHTICFNSEESEIEAKFTVAFNVPPMGDMNNTVLWMVALCIGATGVVLCKRRVREF